MPRTAVILLNYNGAKDTERCITSLQECDEVPLIVLVDNTPYDAALKSVVAKFPEVILLESDANIGFGGGNNIGIRWVLSNTDAEFIFILNNDTVIDKKSIKILENCLDDHPSVGIATPRVVFFDNPSMLWYGGGEVSWVRGGGSVPGVFGDSKEKLAMTERDVSFASGCALLVRREAMVELKGFDERFFMYEEDLELCLRVQKNGWKIRYAPNAVVLHVVQASSRGNQTQYVDMLSHKNENLKFYAFHVFRNRFLNMHLHAKGFNLFKFRVGFTLFVLKRLVFYTIFKRWDGILAMYEGWRSYLNVVSTKRRS